jgi:hypothetical protein
MKETVGVNPNEFDGHSPGGATHDLPIDPNAQFAACSGQHNSHLALVSSFQISRNWQQTPADAEVLDFLSAVQSILDCHFGINFERDTGKPPLFV